MSGYQKAFGSKIETFGYGSPTKAATAAFEAAMRQEEESKKEGWKIG